MGDLFTEFGAVLSDCGTYRYRLTRRWGEGPTALFIMLNPSTADASEDDPTIRRCIGFAKREGCGALEVVNLMAYRATDPKTLPSDSTAVGPDNADHVFTAASEADGPIIAAWGAHKAAGRYAPGFLHGFAVRGLRLMCLKKTAAGAPGHPLYVKADAPLLPFSTAPSRPQGEE